MEQYQQKPKRPYTGPPRPNLMVHDKDIRGMKQRMDALAQDLHQTQEENRQLRSRIDFLEHSINQLMNNQRRF